MSSAITIFFLALLLSLGMTPVVRKLAIAAGIVDQPGEYRRIHDKAIPRLGGIAIFIAFWGGIGLLVMIDPHAASGMIKQSRHIIGLFAGSIVIIAVGIWDDVRGVKPVVKLLAQAMAGLIVFYAGFQIQSLHTPFGPIRFGMMSLPVTLLWIMGTCNAVNLIDGIDGLATGVSLVASITVFVLAVIAGYMPTAWLMAALAGATLGFLVYNFHPASIFLGDTGSLLLGFLIGCTVLLSASYRHAAVGLAIPLIIFALPIADTFLAVLRRWSKRMPISAADREHIHHRLLKLGYSQPQAVTILYALALFFGIVAIVVSLCTTPLQVFIGVLLAIALPLMLRFMKWSEFELVSTRIQRDVKRQRQRSDHWILVNEICNEIQFVRSEHRLKELLFQAFEGLDLDRVTLLTSIPSISRMGKVFSFKWYRDGTDLAEPFPNAWSAHLSITKEDRTIGRVHVLQNADRSELPSDISECLKRICSAMAGRLIPDRAILPSPETDKKIKVMEKAANQQRMLVVDTGSEIAECLEQSLNDDGWKIDVTGNGEDAIEKIQLNFYHLAFVDMKLTTDGISTITRLLQENPALRIIALGTDQFEGNTQEILDLGAIAYLGKPFQPDAVKRVVEATI